jgi:multiple sugar transport system substrate-binding protein
MNMKRRTITVKKAISAVLVAVLLLGIILAVGCGKESKAVTVKFSYPPFGYDSTKEAAFWNKYIAQFEAENPGIKIEMTWESWNNGQPFSKWEQAMSAGDTPDIAYASPRNVIDYAQKGKLLPLTDVVNKLGGASAFSAGMRYFKYNGDWYAVPNCDATQVLMYRKDILQAAGYSAPPSNWSELEEIAKACTGNGTYGLTFYICNQYYTLQTAADFMKAAGGVMLNSKGELVFDSPENLQGLQFFSDLIHVDKVVPPDATAWLYGQLVDGLGTGKVAMAIEWGGYATLMESMYPNTYQNIGYTKIPVGPSGVSGGWQGAGGFFMFKDAKHPEEAKKFIEFMSRPEISKEWCIASGNISPFLSVSGNPDLMSLDWYKAMSEQAPSEITMGWDYGIVPGAAECATPLQDAVVSVIYGSATPAQALKTLQTRAQEALDAAAKK